MKNEIKSSEITNKKVYLNRRLFMRGAALAATTAATGLLYRKLNPPPVEKPKGETLVTVAKSVADNGVRDGFTTNEKLTAIEDITNYNNFYEFSTSKQGVAIEAAGFVSRPWDVAVGGLLSTALGVGSVRLFGKRGVDLVLHARVQVKSGRTRGSAPHFQAAG